ncbi:uncharacterized protein LTR77_004579 [Saxophila tyrrhenica]|uniref:Mitochondrial carrier n=1 Tax=Saxophila tyrrhenica TaxID=1690608 RepID=A0AAV9PDU2_9PEZI|nr:hypothetical protein LTR77_004579 [Saxophila tyrrhenica]
MPAPDDKDMDKSKKTSMESSKKSQTTPQSYTASLLADKDARAFMKKYRTEIAASTSSLLSTFAAFPLDFTKSRMQSYETTFVHTVKDAYRAEGIRAFWRGVGPPLASVTLVRTVSFSIYQRAKYAYDRSLKSMFGQSPLELANAPGSYPSLLTIACFAPAGATAGAFITTMSCPFELTKLNEQLAGKEARQGPSPTEPVRTGAWVTARRMVRDRGFMGLYAGYRLHLLRDTIGTAIYFTTYESAKQLMANAQGKSPTSPYAVLLAGGLCGIIYPIDVAKTLYQKALLSAGSGYAARPKIRVLSAGSYRGTTADESGLGLGVSVMRSCMINAIFFSNFEMIKKRINAVEI